MTHSNEYTTHIDERSPEWQALRARRLAIDGRRCVYCGREMQRPDDLSIHHVRYTDDLCDIHSVVTVCQVCHALLHGRIPPWRGQYNPTSRAAKQRLKWYMLYANGYIDGKFTRNLGLFLDYDNLDEVLAIPDDEMRAIVAAAEGRNADLLVGMREFLREPQRCESEPWRTVLLSDVRRLLEHALDETAAAVWFDYYAKGMGVNEVSRDVGISSRKVQWNMERRQNVINVLVAYETWMAGVEYYAD